MTQTIRLSSPYQKSIAKRLIDAAPLDYIAEVKAPTRSLEQNAKLHAMLSDIARAKPLGRSHSPEVWKCVAMDACGMKPKWVPGLDGESIVNTGYRSSRLTKAQMSELIEFLYSFGAENGVEWSEPKGDQQCS